MCDCHLLFVPLLFPLNFNFWKMVCAPASAISNADLGGCHVVHRIAEAFFKYSVFFTFRLRLPTFCVKTILFLAFFFQISKEIFENILIFETISHRHYFDLEPLLCKLLALKEFCLKCFD